MDHTRKLALVDPKLLEILRSPPPPTDTSIVDRKDLNDEKSCMMAIVYTAADGYRYSIQAIEDTSLDPSRSSKSGTVEKVIATSFFDCVDEFLHNNVDNDLLVGVHCTHGVNRTGYLVCKRELRASFANDPDIAQAHTVQWSTLF
ncbi:hypothetical protein LSAT2_008558 [Lamellibrachia satsuma]|nr:hypothetical protein LSAT2_008558 [Lamellibrachia satsuma]